MTTEFNCLSCINMSQFDYIIAGAGASGLMLAYELTLDPNWQPSILIIDKDLKERNDRTWCFWEQESNPLEHIVFRKWETAFFQGPGFKENMSLYPYSYKMIRGVDFYEFMKLHLSKFVNVTWLSAEINSIKDHQAITTDGNYKAATFFDSTKSLKDFEIPTKYHQLLQHFKGYIIETTTEEFDPTIFTYMDFDIDQKGDCRFGYILPFSPTKALVEYTLFSTDLLSSDEYTTGLESYIVDNLGIKSYKIAEKEFGVIPMTDYPFNMNPEPGVFRIGTSGGFTKASTGYTFLRTQKIAKQIAKNLRNGKPPLEKLPFQQRRFKKYDSTLLHVLAQSNLSGAEVFTQLFKKNGPQAIFKFLDEETTLGEELRIMNSTPVLTFAKAFIERLHI